MNTAQEDTLETVMRRIQIKRAAIKGNKAMDFNVPAVMLQHRTYGRCICDTCSDARPSPPLSAPTLHARKIPPGPESCGNPPRKRTPNGMNSPTTSPDFGDHLPFALRVMSGPNRKPASIKGYLG